MLSADEEGSGGEFEDDDLGVIGGGEINNPRCILTQVHVSELLEPVEDSLGFIYERQAIVDYIAKAVQARGSCQNPSRQRVPITLDELKDCAKKIRRFMQKTKKRQQATQASAPAEEVL